MARIRRQTLVALMLVLYGSVSLCTFGFHALTHGSDSCHHPDHSHDVRSAVHKDPHHGDSSHGDPNDCSFCRFLAQGQLNTEPVRLISRPFTSPHVHLILAVVATRDRHPSCSPRAPPILAATCRATV